MEELAEVFGDAIRAAEGFGQAVSAKGAPSAPWLEDGGRNSAAPQQLMKLDDSVLGLGAEFGSERDLASRLTLLVIDRAAEDGGSEHFFEAKGLGAELDVVVVPAALLTAFVFDGRHDLDDGLSATFSSRLASKLDKISASEEAVASGSDPEPAFGAYSFPLLIPRRIGTLMK